MSETFGGWKQQNEYREHDEENKALTLYFETQNQNLEGNYRYYQAGAVAHEMYNCFLEEEYSTELIKDTIDAILDTEESYKYVVVKELIQNLMHGLYHKRDKSHEIFVIVKECIDNELEKNKTCKNLYDVMMFIENNINNPETINEYFSVTHTEESTEYEQEVLDSIENIISRNDIKENIVILKSLLGNTNMVSQEVEDIFFANFNIDQLLREGKLSVIEVIVLCSFYNTYSASEVDLVIKNSTPETIFVDILNHLYGNGAKYTHEECEMIEYVLIKTNSLFLDVLYKNVYIGDTLEENIELNTLIKILNKGFEGIISNNRKLLESQYLKLSCLVATTSSAKEANLKISLQDIENTESTIRSGQEILENPVLFETMKSTILKNYGNGELAYYLVQEFEESLHNPDTNVLCVEYEGELAAFCRVEHKEDGSAYVASLNVVENAKGANIARLTMVHIMKERYPDMVMTAHSYPEQVALPMYLELGFVATGVEKLSDGGELFTLVRDPEKTYKAMEYIDIKSSQEVRPVFDVQVKMGMILIRIEKYKEGQRLWFTQKSGK